MVEQATTEQPREVLTPVDPDQNPAAVALGRLGGLKGGKARAKKLTMCKSMRRFTRLTNGFSKKIKNHEFVIALHFMCYDSVRIHQTLMTTPAVAAGIADRALTLEDLISLLEQNEAKTDPLSLF